MPLTQIPGRQAADGTYTEADLGLSDVETHNVSVQKHGFMPKLPGNPNYFFAGNGLWVPGWLLPQPGVAGEIAYSAGLNWARSDRITAIDAAGETSLRCLYGQNAAKMMASAGASVLNLTRGTSKQFTGSVEEVRTLVRLRNSSSTLEIISETLPAEDAIRVVQMGEETFKVSQSGAVMCRAMRLVDGNQGAGKVLTSDADGNAYWDWQAGAPNICEAFRIRINDCVEPINNVIEIENNNNYTEELMLLSAGSWDVSPQQLIMVCNHPDDRNSWLWRFNCYMDIRLPDWRLFQHQARIRMFFQVLDLNDNPIEYFEVDRAYLMVDSGGGDMVATDNAVVYTPGDGYTGAKLQLHGDALVVLGGDWERGPRLFRPVLEYAEWCPGHQSQEIRIHTGYLEGHLLCRI